MTTKKKASLPPVIQPGMQWHSKHDAHTRAIVLENSSYHVSYNPESHTIKALVWSTRSGSLATIEWISPRVFYQTYHQPQQLKKNTRISDHARTDIMRPRVFQIAHGDLVVIIQRLNNVVIFVRHPFKRSTWSSTRGTVVTRAHVTPRVRAQLEWAHVDDFASAVLIDNSVLKCARKWNVRHPDAPIHPDVMDSITALTKTSPKK